MNLPTATPVHIAVNALLAEQASAASFRLTGDSLEEYLAAQGYTWVEAIDSGWLAFEEDYERAGWTVTFLGRGMGDTPEWDFRQ
jgi:hypothetical protein